MTRRVLIVDDVLVNRKLAVAFFDRLGWLTAEADGGHAALDWLSTHPAIDLLLLDISMPDMSGEVVCSELRKNPTFVDLPIVAYTAHALNHDVERFLANGFNKVLLKPASMQAFRDILAQVFPDG